MITEFFEDSLIVVVSSGSVVVVLSCGIGIVNMLSIVDQGQPPVPSVVSVRALTINVISSPTTTFTSPDSDV
jgi:hypothetical protein